MRSFSRRSLLGLLVTAPVAVPVSVAAAQNHSSMTAGEILRAKGLLATEQSDELSSCLFDLRARLIAHEKAVAALFEMRGGVDG